MLGMVKTPLYAIPSRRYASWGMAGLWERVRMRTENAIGRLKAEGKTTSSGPLRAPKRIATSIQDKPIISPFDAVEQAKAARKQLPIPNQLWMQSAYIRGSSRKMTMLARQIITLPLDAALLQMHFSSKKFAQTVEMVLSQLKGTLLKRGANAAQYFIKEATVGRGSYLKRMEIRGRGRTGIQWRGHTFVRICVHKPDPQVLVRKMLKIRKIPREDRPIMKKLDYY
jgi:ribosomal protein L22